MAALISDPVIAALPKAADVLVACVTQAAFARRPNGTRAARMGRH